MIADVLRAVAMVEILFVIGIQVALMLRAREWHAPPCHIYGMGISYLGFAIVTMIELELRLGTPPTWRTPIAFVAATAGLFAQLWQFHVWKGYEPGRPSL